MFTQTPQSISQEYELNFLQIAGSVRNCCNWFMGQNDSWSDSEWQNDPPSYEWWWPVADFRLLILFAIAIFSNLMTRHERRNLPSHGPVFAKVTDEIMTSSWLWRNDLLNEALKNRPCGWLTWFSQLMFTCFQLIYQIHTMFAILLIADYVNWQLIGKIHPGIDRKSVV